MTPGPWGSDALYDILERIVDSEHEWTSEDHSNHQTISMAPELDAYRAYIEGNLERIERAGWTPVCFAEFRASEWCANHMEKQDG